MVAPVTMTMKPGFLPLNAENWDDFERLFGERGACGGCWCMLWRLTPKAFRAQKGEGNRKAMQQLAADDISPGIIAYDNEIPIGWCAVAPRQVYSALARSRVLKPVDDQPVWSVSCFFIDKAYRRQGVSVKLLAAAVAYAQSKGARIVEGYPVEPNERKYPPAFAWTGLSTAFQRAGFSECARRSPTRPIMRLTIGA